MNAELDTLKATELRLGLPGSDDQPQNPPPPAPVPRPATKRSLEDDPLLPVAQKPSSAQESTRVAKAQVVGWPPVRSYRKNAMKTETAAADGGGGGGGGGGLFVKVSMDGAPYLRKIDLKVYRGYKELREGLEAMFKCFEGSKGGLDLAITYEDKDGDLMLVGDVPWEMFTCSCKKLRIIRGSETVKG